MLPAGDGHQPWRSELVWLSCGDRQSQAQADAQNDVAEPDDDNNKNNGLINRMLNPLVGSGDKRCFGFSDNLLRTVYPVIEKE